MKVKEYERLMQHINVQEEKAKYWEDAGEDGLADIYRRSAQPLKQRAIRLRKELAHEKRVESIVKGRSPRGSVAERPKTTKRELTKDMIIAGALKGIEKATGKNFALDTLQHVTSKEECKLWVQVLKGMCTKDGKLDKKSYCSALNIVRDNILFTIGELRQAIKDALRDGNQITVPGYETMVKQYETNAAVIAAEINANGGKVN